MPLRGARREQRASTEAVTVVRVSEEMAAAVAVMAAGAAAAELLAVSFDSAAVVGRAGIRIADLGREELNVVPRRRLAGIGDGGRHAARTGRAGERQSVTTRSCAIIAFPQR
jgi:hypothetical protein